MDRIKNAHGVSKQSGEHAVASLPRINLRRTSLKSNRETREKVREERKFPKGVLIDDTCFIALIKDITSMSLISATRSKLLRRKHHFD